MKWKPVHRPETRKTENLGPFCSSIKTKTALVDELALEFHDAFVYSRQLIDEGRISQTVYNAVAAVDNKLDQMSGPQNASLWCFDALRNRTEWKDVRHLAQTALELYRAEK